MKQREKRPWTRGEKLLWLAPLLLIVGAGAALWGPTVARRVKGLPDAVLRVPDQSLGLETLAICGRWFDVGECRGLCGAKTR